jgi:Protein of unknown function (DUF3108)
MLKFLFLLALSTSAFAQDRKLEIDYTATFLGLPVGEGQVRSTINGTKYNTTTNAKASGIGSVFAGGYANVVARGDIGKSRLHGTFYSYEAKGKEGLNSFKMELVKDSVKSAIFTPEKPQIGEIVPLKDEHKRNIFDPIAATTVVVQEGQTMLSQAGCGNTQQVFDGKLRYDITLTYMANEKVEIDGYKGEVVKCKLQMTAIAGYRTDKPIMKENEKVPVFVWLMPVNNSRLMLIYKVQLNTKFGLGVMTAQRVNLGY